MARVADFTQRPDFNPARGMIFISSQFGSGVNGWIKVRYGGGYFVAIHGGGIALNTARSTDGIIWTEQNGAAALQWQSLAYGNGIFMAVANNGAGNQFMRSTDFGLNWSSIAEPSTRQWTSICYAGSNTFLACAQDGAGNQFGRSTDLGLTWASIAEPFGATLQWQSIFCNESTGVAIAVANNGVGNQIARSTDSGASWGSIAEPAVRVWTSVTWGKNIWAAMANDTGATATGGMYSNDDGATWNLSQVWASENVTDICFGDNKFIGCKNGGGSNLNVVSSFDAQIYTRINLQAYGTTALNSIVWGLDRFVTIENSGIAFVS